MPLYNRPPEQGQYKYVRLREQLFYADFGTMHKDIAIQEDILKQFTHSLLSNPEDVGAGVFMVHAGEVQVLAKGSSTLNIPGDNPGKDNDLRAFKEKSEPYGFKVSKM